MLVGGSTGSGKSVFLFSMLAAMLMTHPKKEDLQLILSSAKLEDFIHFEGLPHLYSGNIISDADEATRVIKEVIFEESERRGKLLAEARVANIIEYNKTATEKLAPIVVVIDEFADIIEKPELRVYTDDFGTRKGDHCLVADFGGKVVGAVWTRIMNDYGHVDDETPSFAISLYKEYRGLGIGSQLMVKMLELLKWQGYKRASLAVQKANYAVKMYKAIGFETVEENDEEFIMVCEL